VADGYRFTMGDGGKIPEAGAVPAGELQTNTCLGINR
jgi:hypothetical protein